MLVRLLPSEGRDPMLVINPLDLKRALWLQLASVIAGQRKVKKCEDPKCPSPYIDVTNSARPGARRMHGHCAERVRKERYITELLGHSQVSFTMQTYAHVLPEVQRQVATKMDEILRPKPVATTVATKPVSGRIV